MKLPLLYSVTTRVHQITAISRFPSHPFRADEDSISRSGSLARLDGVPGICYSICDNHLRWEYKQHGTARASRWLARIASLCRVYGISRPDRRETKWRSDIRIEYKASQDLI